MRRSDLSNRKRSNATINSHYPLYRPGFTNIVNQFIISKAIEPFFALLGESPKIQTTNNNNTYRKNKSQCIHIILIFYSQKMRI